MHEILGSVEADPASFAHQPVGGLGQTGERDLEAGHVGGQPVEVEARARPADLPEDGQAVIEDRVLDRLGDMHAV